MGCCGPLVVDKQRRMEIAHGTRALGTFGKGSCACVNVDDVLILTTDDSKSGLEMFLFLFSYNSFVFV